MQNVAAAHHSKSCMAGSPLLPRHRDQEGPNERAKHALQPKQIVPTVFSFATGAMAVALQWGVCCCRQIIAFSELGSWLLAKVRKCTLSRQLFGVLLQQRLDSRFSLFSGQVLNVFDCMALQQPPGSTGTPFVSQRSACPWCRLT
jgi:hypothetical protein